MPDQTLTLDRYWEDRAARLARHEGGLSAVCSYGMPRLYNLAHHLAHSAALEPWFRRMRDQRVLEIGCGVGRWTRRLARHNRVTAMDLSPSMLAVARDNLAELGLDCEFRQGNVADFATGERFDSVLSVTVLQHVIDDQALLQALGNLRDQLRPGGRLLMLEVAPDRGTTRNDSAIFRARSFQDYRSMIHAAGFSIESVRGVDPMPFKYRLLPLVRAWPRSVAMPLLLTATLVSLPFDLLLGRWLARTSWHKLIVCRREA